MSTSASLLLFVEDEPFIHEIVGPALADAGFSIARATRGEEALLLLNRRKAEFCALVTDVDLGRGPSGWEIARLARDLVADIPVVYASGKSADRFEAEAVAGSLMVTKPYGPTAIVAAVETLLRGAG
jgi:DNA-binding response OmpR family regulator